MTQTKFFFSFSKLVLSGALLASGLVACTSKVSETLTPEEEEAAAKAGMSSVELLEISGRSETPTCSAQNKLRLLVTLNAERAIKCRDNTQRMSGLALGPICPSGVSIANFTVSSAWTECATVKVCGQSAKTVRDLTAPAGSKMHQIEFSSLPWGCSGAVEWAYADQVDNPDLVKKIEVNFKPPPCPDCAASGIATCDVCGVDAIKPVITEVIGEISGCNQIKVIVFADDKESGLHRDAYSFDGGTTWQSSSEYIFTTMNLDMAADRVRVRDRAGNISIGTRRVQLIAPPCPCAAPWGETIPSGESRAAFKVGSVACTMSCDTQTIQRTCTNGVLSGDATYRFNECKLDGCPKCNLPWGEQISHGQSVAAFEKPNVACADQCRSTTLKCERGVLSGDAATYVAKACAFVKPKCNCEFAGIIIPDGGSRPVFAKAQPTCAETCTAGASVTCTAGTLSGNTNLTQLSCDQKECKCTTAWGQKLSLNEEADAYKTGSPLCTQNIRCNDSTNKVKIKCVNVDTNQLVISMGNGNIADFKSPSCSEPVCACIHLGVVFKPTDPDLTVYRFDKSTPPATCAGQGNFGKVKCVQSGNTFTPTGDVNTSVYKFTLCQDPPGGGNSSENIGAGSGGGAGGGVGNDIGEGEGFRPRSKPANSRGCDVNSYPFVCSGGSMNFNMQLNGACMAPPLEGPPVLPADINDITRRVQGDTYIAAYSRKTVACTDSCSRYIGYLECGRNGWVNMDKYPFQTCTEVCP